MISDYKDLRIGTDQAATIAWERFGKKGQATPLSGELDFNFKIVTNDGETLVLKICRPDVDEDTIDFQQKLIGHIEKSSVGIKASKIVPDTTGRTTTSITDEKGNKRIVRMLTWIDGRLWSEVNPRNATLMYSLGTEAGKITKALTGFDHGKARRTLDWDLARVEWTREHIRLFPGTQQGIVRHFLDTFAAQVSVRDQLRRSVVHNDVNDNNVIVSSNLKNPKVEAIIDYGDAIFTYVINDLAIVIAYSIMNKPNPLDAALSVVKGYHEQFPLQDAELEVLHTLVAARLIISVAKSTINRQKEPENEYLLISEKPAWELLEKWNAIHHRLAYVAFRSACGMVPHPRETDFISWTGRHTTTLADMFPSRKATRVIPLDMSVGSTWLGHKDEYTDNERTAGKIRALQLEHPDGIIAGGYSEIRPFYSTDAYRKEGNDGPEYRTAHLGVDVWLPQGTPIHAPINGVVYSIYDNNHDKDYGPTLILQHNEESVGLFYSLYGHLSRTSIPLVNVGQEVNQGQLIGYIGNSDENGNWAPHLHFQWMLDMLGNKHDFPGVAYQNEIAIWTSLCPDPNLLFKHAALNMTGGLTHEDMVRFRQHHLGKGLSLSYDEPLKIARGDGVYLIDESGRKYIDTVNNVAHVGHEHPRVVRAGQQQMAILNTNTRYLHDNINEFADELLATLPKELSVVHVVNSGSEANELALRMAMATTGQKDMIAVETGYHGNTNACIGISSYKFDGEGGSGAPAHTRVVPLPDRFRGKYRGEHTGAQYAAHVREEVQTLQAKGRNVAAFICESIISCGGQIELPDDYLKIAYQAVRKAGGVCIADEIQTGCGRVGSAFWAFQLHNVTPDIVTIGKPIGNGHPLAAVVCTQKVADAFANGMEYFNTFGGNPVSCAIGREVLRVIKEEDLQKHALDVGNYLIDGLRRLQTEFPILADVRGKGLFLGFELADKDKHPLENKAAYLANRMKALGILMSTDGPDHNVLKIKPPLVFSRNHADELITRLRTVFQEDYMKSNIRDGSE